jgi:uncharacterized protein (DUF1800 family)
MAQRSDGRHQRLPQTFISGNQTMALDARGAALALHRFGFGPRPGTIAAIASDPRGALVADLDRPNAGEISSAGLPSSGAIDRAVVEFNAARLAKERLETRRKEEAKAAAAQQGAQMADNAGTMEAAVKTPNPKLPQPETPGVENFFAEAKAHFEAALRAETGFVERLTWFWANHFCVNSDATFAAGAYLREAIRPHVLGHFADLLQAVESHPSMLFYLNNENSMGPMSVAGINNSRGLNENLAREILELHTLGVRTVYDQQDVTNFAKVITGWTVLNPVRDPVHGGEFLFFQRLHEPGPQRVIGKDYRDTGLEQGRAVLNDLARHPATAKHIAVKLARHFIADDPPPELVDTLTTTFIETDGDLWKVSKALVTAPQAMAPEQLKIKRPSEWVLSYLRAEGFNMVNPRNLVPTLNRLGEPLWRPPSPKGFPDDNGAWLENLSHRLDTANAFAQNNAERVDPKDLVEIALGPLASAETRQAVGRAETKAQALTLALMAPEFQRR